MTVLGTIIPCEPSFGVFANKVVKVAPASVVIKIFTLAVFTPFPVVPATFHVIISVAPEFQLTAAPCDVTTKGPAAAVVVAVILSEAELPPTEKLSLTVKSKFIVLLTEGTTSHVVAVAPVKTVGKVGIYLFGEGSGSSDLKAGPTVDVDTGGIVAGVVSVCSQQ